MRCSSHKKRVVILAQALLLTLFHCLQPAAALAQQVEPTAELVKEPEGLYLEGVTLTAFSRVRLGRPLTILAMVRNTGKEARSVVAAAKINSAPDMQAATLVTVPPQEKRSVELRLRVPDAVNGTSIEYSVSLNDPINPSQILVGAQGTPLFESRQMNINEDGLLTAIAIKSSAPPMPDWYWPWSDRVMEYEWIVAARVDSSHSRRTVTIDQAIIPTLAADWQGLDEFVINTDQIFHDPAVIGSMNRWIASGGRAWIMLDHIAPENIRLLLPDGCDCEMLDDVELNRFVVETTGLSKLAEADRTVEEEQPVRLRRVVQTGGMVTHQVEGYPAAIWYRVGKGTLLVTTLGADGWIQPRTESRFTREDFITAFQLCPWAVSMADRLHEKKLMLSPIENAEVQYPLQQIGNPVLNRRYVLSMVFGFCGLLGVVAGLCWLTNTMLRLAWLIPLISVVATVPLVVSALRLRREIPDTSAHLQVIEVQPGSRTVQGMQWTASYLGSADGAKLQAKGDATVYWPRGTEQLDLRRWTWQDYDQWELTSASWPKGMWQLNSRFTLPAQNYDVLARIDDTGLHLQLPSTLEHNLQDSVLQFWPGDPIPCGAVDRGAEQQVGERHLSEIDSWLADSIVSDEQMRREQVYRQIKATGNQTAFPSYPALFGWTPLWANPTAWNDKRDERGSALVVLPIKLLPTPSGQRVHVPHSVVHIANAERFGAVSTAYSNQSGWWRGATTLQSTAGLRCSLPPQVCPIKAEAIVCELQVRAPQRKVTLFASTPEGQRTTIAEYVSPTALQTLRIVDPGLLADIRDGSIEFDLEIGEQMAKDEAAFGDQQAIWQVDFFRMSVEGVVEDR